jgi:hypothetical protein
MRRRRSEMRKRSEMRIWFSDLRIWFTAPCTVCK